ncbi:MAG: imidazole glycerol phosphate synthase subunit HisH [Candidatus Hydrogenedentota bacterium]
MIAVVDYGMGNLRSAQKGIEKAGFEARITDNPDDVLNADGVVLPGVGAFGDCYSGLADRGFVGPIREVAARGTPLLGICVGMQLFFEGSEEGDVRTGLGLIPGRVKRFPPSKISGLKVPHMGWNQIRPVRACPLFQYVSANPALYFVHSYYPSPESTEDVIAVAEYGLEFPAIVGRANVMGTQFHPEKSQREGIALLRAFGEIVASSAPERLAMHHTA